MIHRYPTKCSICGHNNTLRITIGNDTHQEHNFLCAGCGEPNKVALKIDFVNRKRFDEVPFVTFPTFEINCIHNCEESVEEGTITNLDPIFPVSEDKLHKDRHFGWMDEVRKTIPNLKEQTATALPGEKRWTEITAELGGNREFREIIATTLRAYNLTKRNEPALVRQQLLALQKIIAAPKEIQMQDALMILSMAFLGRNRAHEYQTIGLETRECIHRNDKEYRRFISQFLNPHAGEFADSVIEIVNEYLQSYDQLSQVWLYASRNEDLPFLSVSSSRDLQKVKMFYGNAFETLSAALVLPACLNNVKNGRAFDEFESMNLTKYLTINKANRANPFRNNVPFGLFHDEFDSTIRNSSHHSAMRMSGKSPHYIDYRSANHGGWKTMRYTEYLYKCNRIMFCLMRLFALHTTLVRFPPTV